jgi:hypothetical protein
MKNGITKTGIIHIFTVSNECICDLNIQIDKEVSREYAELHKEKFCKNCINVLKKNNML